MPEGGNPDVLVGSPDVQEYMRSKFLYVQRVL